MQLFNQINARKLGDKEYNVFAGFFSNCWFIGITVITFILQMTIVYIGGRPMRTVPLTAYENFYAIGIAALVIPWCAFCKMFMPAVWFDRLAMNEAPMSIEERMDSFILGSSFRASYS